MNTRKTLGYGTRNLFFAIAVMLALAFIACDDGSTTTTITYTVTQTGGAAGAATSTGIVFTFSSSVDSLDLTAADIVVSGAASKGTGELTGSGTSWTLPITVNYEGMATVAIANNDIETTEKNVVVYKAGPGQTAITYTATQTGGADNTANTTGIVFTFSASVSGLTADNITVGGVASKGTGALTGSGTSWTLPINVTSAGLVTVSISKTGIEAAQKSVLVYKEGQTAPQYWTITWDLNGGEKGTGAYPEQIVKGDNLYIPTPDPTKANSTFGGWYSDLGLTQKHFFASSVTKNLTLYAKWEAAITYTATQTGGTDGIADSTGIVFAFSASVDSLNLTAADITVGGAASKGSATLTGSGTSWTLETITVNNTGWATVSINKSGIDAAPMSVRVYQAGQINPTDITYTAIQTGGTDGTTTSTGIVFTFSESVSGLTAADITVSGAASKGSATLTGSGTSWTLAPITVNDAGLATVSISKNGIESGTKGVLVYKQGGQALEYMDFLGTWLMIGADNNWEPEQGKGYGYNETITLTADQFRLDSTYQGEYLYFNISGWTKITGADLTVMTAGSQYGPSTNVTYAEGWRLSLYGGTTNGYNASYTAMNLYKIDDSGTAQIRMRRSTDTGSGNIAPLLARVYVKQ
jgi:uncharacterized repeat protein (TIGR02543 family)